MMKRYIYSLIITLITVVSAYGQTPVNKLHINDYSYEAQEEEVIIRFRADVPRNLLSKNKSLYVLPVITNGEYKVSMRPIVIRSGKAKRLTVRRLRAAGMDIENEDSIKSVRLGEEIIYQARLPRQAWMQESSIIIESLLTGCCNITKGEPLLLAENTLPQEEPKPEPEVIVSVPEKPETTGKKMERSFTFVSPASDFDAENMVVYDEDRENAIIVYYHLNESVIREDHMNNRQTLINLEAVINTINNSTDSKVKYIVIAGFASPEGSFEINDRLAFERAVAVKNFVMSKTTTPGKDILLYNGSADWRGLKLLIEESDMPYKTEILHIINTMPIWDSQAQRGRMGEIMKFRNGEAYFYMQKHVFPKLRNGAFIRVYYEDK